MKVELEFNTEINDKAEILAKMAQLVKTAKELGFNLEEAELGSKEKHKEKMEKVEDEIKI